MGSETEISWASHTWNPWQGCSKVSPACKHCYMFSDKKRYGQDPTQVVRSASPTFRAPLKRFGARSTKGTPGTFQWPSGGRVFTCSWSDFFHADADPWRDEAWEIIRQRPDLVFMVLTKRPERIRDHLPADWGTGWRHVWLGTTVEDQQRADERIPELLRAPAAVRFVSCEPLLGPVDLRRVVARDVCVVDALEGLAGASVPHAPCERLHWVIAGGESGHNARPSHPDWFRDLRDQCRDRPGHPLSTEVAFHFKQWGAWIEYNAPGADPAVVREHDPDTTSAEAIVAGCPHRHAFVSEDGRTFASLDDLPEGVGCRMVVRLGKANTGCQLDGRTHLEFPQGVARV